MLSFYFKSLSFKNPLIHKKQLYISVELAEGAPRTTEIVNYFPRTNFAIFSETLEFTVRNPQENTFFHLEVYEENEKSPQSNQRICRETIHLNKMVNNNSKELQVNTTYGPAIVELTLDLSEEFNEMVLGHDKPISKEQTHRREQAMSLDSLNLIKMGPLLYEFVLALSPLVLLKRDIIAFFTWKDPHTTLFASIILTIFLFFNQKIIAVGLLFFFLFSKRLIPLLLQVKPMHDELKGTALYKRNMIMMRDLMQVTVYIDELQNKLFNDPDKTLLLHILLFVKRFAPILSIALFFGDITKLLVLGYWTFLLYQTDAGNNIIGKSYTLLSDFLDSLSILLVPIEKLEQLLIGQDLKAKRLESTGSNRSNRSSLHAGLFMDSPHNSQDPLTNTDQKIVVRQKTFITYENQRWWVGKGWCTKMFADERPPWSDDLGKLALNRESFRLPGANWVWDTDWSYVVNSNTDALGWEYANKFSTFNKPGHHKHLMQVVRRRKWARRCVEVQETEEATNHKILSRSPTGEA